MIQRHLVLAALALAACAAASPASATAISVGGPGTYTQTFDSLPITSTMGNWVNDSTLAGWSAFYADGSAQNVYLSGTGQVTTGHLWSLSPTTSGTDRAFGAHTSSAFQSAIIAVALTNTGSAALAGLDIAFDGEQYRNTGSGTAQTAVLSYGIGASYASVTNWSAPGGNFDFSSVVTGTPAAIVNGNTVGLSAGHGGSIATPLNVGDTLWVRWTFPSVPTGAGSDFLALDNFSASAIPAVPEPGTSALLLAGLGSVSFLARRRKA